MLKVLMVSKVLGDELKIMEVIKVLRVLRVFKVLKVTRVLKVVGTEGLRNHDSDHNMAKDFNPCTVSQ